MVRALMWLMLASDGGYGPADDALVKLEEKTSKAERDAARRLADNWRTSAEN